MSMEPFVLRLPHAIAEALRKQAKTQGVSAASLARELICRGVDGPETLEAVIIRAIDRAVPRITRDLPTRQDVYDELFRAIRDYSAEGNKS